jgi:hypothetical protein
MIFRKAAMKLLGVRGLAPIVRPSSAREAADPGSA